MSTVYLGLPGSEVLLPAVKYLGTDKPVYPIYPRKHIEERRMATGTIRYGYFGTKREWPCSWGYLTQEEMDLFLNIRAENQALRFQNNWVSSTWYDVVMLEFEYAELDIGLRGMQIYRCSFKLREL